MSKTPVSLTLSDANLLWLRGRAGRQGGNLSAVLDALVSEARAGRLGSATPKSIVGTIDLAPDDPDLSGADDAVRQLFAASLARPMMVREAAKVYGVSKPRKRRG